MARLFLLLPLLLLASTAEAEPAGSEQLNVKSIMCSLLSKQCTAFFNGPVANKSSCTNTTRVRWDASTSEGKIMLSLFQAAHLSDRKVIVWDEGCISAGNGVTDPQLAWLQLL